MICLRRFFCDWTKFSDIILNILLVIDLRGSLLLRGVNKIRVSSDYLIRSYWRVFFFGFLWKYIRKRDKIIGFLLFFILFLLPLLKWSEILVHSWLDLLLLILISQKFIVIKRNLDALSETNVFLWLFFFWLNNVF